MAVPMLIHITHVRCWFYRTKTEILNASVLLFIHLVLNRNVMHNAHEAAAKLHGSECRVAIAGELNVFNILYTCNRIVDVWFSNVSHRRDIYLK